ncbi:MAG: linear amide C-N hydrolase [Thermoanaerobaculales bacterium]|nr:linear amide C-N hydrolase [Thermoanaerobaculales bacterium]
MVSLVPCLLLAVACGYTEKAVDLTPEFEPPRTTCSSINLVNRGYSVFGKNLDNTYTTEGLILINKRGVERTAPYVSTIGARARWISRYASVNFSFVHVGYVWTGMNEKGLVISMMGIPEIVGPPPDERPPLQDGLWIQYMLDTCETVEEVLEAARDVRILTVDHYHIADRFGTSAAFECLRGEEIFYQGEEFPVSVLTNSTYSDSIQSWNRYSDFGFRQQNQSLRRFCIAGERIENFSSTDADSAVEYAFGTLHNIRSEWIAGYPNTTQWSFVFDTNRRRVFFKTYSHPGIKYFDLYDFDVSCRNEVQMLDVQTPLSGNVFPYFQNVTFEAACDHYRHFLESFQGQNPSQAHIENEISYYMNFPCVGLTSPPRHPSSRRVRPDSADAAKIRP